MDWNVRLGNRNAEPSHTFLDQCKRRSLSRRPREGYNQRIFWSWAIQRSCLSSLGIVHCQRMLARTKEKHVNTQIKGERERERERERELPVRGWLQRTNSECGAVGRRHIMAGTLPLLRYLATAVIVSSSIAEGITNLLQVALVSVTPPPIRKAPF